MTKNKIINACAGSGKTYALIQRMLQLLEQDAPGRILAITFTKKAAAEIHQRLLDALTEKAESGHAWAKEKRRRILLAETAADKIHIHTFHSWFHFLLSGESRPTARRRLIESETAPREEAWRRWLKNPEIYSQLPDILTRCSPPKLKAALFNVANKINAWRLYAASGRQRNAEDIEKEIESAKHHLRDVLKKFIDAAGESSTTILQAKESAENFLTDDDNRDWRKSFFTAQDTLRKNLLKGAEKTGRELPEILQEIAAADWTFLEKTEERLTLQFNEKMTTLAELFLQEYEKVKSEENIMTFNDLEYEAYLAATRQDGGGGGDFLARISGQFGHVLIDEFQDSSPLQWRIVYRWLQRAVESGKPPSVFIVGDKRQAIYRFRNGDARMLDEAANYLRGDYRGEIVESKICRRCAPPVLDMVNALFPALKSEWLESNAALPGAVEWNEPPTASPPTASRNPRNPLKTPPAQSASIARRENWANLIGARLDEIIGKVGIGDDNRPCRAEDVMVLLPQLTHAKELTKTFEERGLPYGVRGGGVSFLHSFACRDILALLSALLSTTNSLSLAQSLKSPLFSFTESQFADVADDGDVQTPLWTRLFNNRAAATHEARAHLGRWHSWAREGVLPAHDLLSKIYADGDILSRYAAATAMPSRRRVVGDLLALLDFSLNNDGGRKPLPHQFLAACAAAAEEKTPPSAATGGGIQLMTIHGAKGLEKPVVVIADTSFGKSHGGDKSDSVDLLIDWPMDADAPSELIFRPRALKRAYSQLVKKEEELRETEYENLLYVAMTRACQFLLIFSTAEHKNARAERLKKIAQETAQNHNGAWRTGAPPPAAAPVTTPPRPSAPPPPAATPVGSRRTGAAKRGEELHRFVALLLAGLSEEEAHNIAAPGDKSIAAAARQILAAPPLRELLAHCAEFHSEAEFVEDGKIYRLDLLIIGKDGESWVVDYKSGGCTASGGGDLSRYHAQLQKYRDIVGKKYPQQTIRMAIVTAAGEWHEIAPDAAAAL